MASALHIAVFLGGPSAEREVSLRSGAGVARALQSLGHQVVDIDPLPGWVMPAGIDVAFLALHGAYGEDGTIQQELENLGVPYTGSGVEGSRIAFDKVESKERFVGAGVRTARYFVVEKPDAKIPVGWSCPLVVKPARQGSSVGLQFVDHENQWQAAVRSSLEHDSRLVVEPRISGRETTVAILDGRALPIVEVRPKVGSYDFQNKYTAGRTEYFCPADFPEKISPRIQAEALKAFNSVGARDYGRVDVMVDEGFEPVVLEVNTLPGMTETSLFPKAAAVMGITYAEVCQRMIDLAMRRSAHHGILSHR